MLRDVHAAGFSLYTESNAANLGNFAAGNAAEARDASTGWDNPAGLALLHHPQMVISAIGAFPSLSLSGTSMFSTEGTPDPYVQSFNNIQGGRNAVFPTLHIAKPLGPHTTFGLSVLSPFGSTSQWGNNSPVRYAATDTQLLVVEVSPELGAELVPHVYVGLGLDLQWARVKFNQVLGSPADLQYLETFGGGGIYPAYLDSLSDNVGRSFGIGAHAGVLFVFRDNHTRVGVNYVSQVPQQYSGHSMLTGRLADPEVEDPTANFLSETLRSNVINMPDVLTLSAYHELNETLAVLASLVYTGWSSFRTIELGNIAAYSPELGEQSLLDVSTKENYRNTVRVALGLNYKFTEKFMWRVGGGFDETPTVNRYRDVRLPDGNRWALSVGSHWQWRKNLAFDWGYTYLFVPGGAKINHTQMLGETSSYQVNGVAQLHAQVAGLQLVWTID